MTSCWSWSHPTTLPRMEIGPPELAVWVLSANQSAHISSKLSLETQSPALVGWVSIYGILATAIHFFAAVDHGHI